MDVPFPSAPPPSWKNIPSRRNIGVRRVKAGFGLLIDAADTMWPSRLGWVEKRFIILLRPKGEMIRMNQSLASVLAIALICSLSAPCFADFQYSETSKITGGAAAGAMKFVGVFSKDARQATQGSNSTISLKGNRMRREDSLGQIEIIDLDGRRITQIDTKKKTYSTMTFDEMKARMEEARKKAA